uniref:Calponin-homology (CH) domain-containing protein n=1 Tax=Macrostomum lignano TaxID=282301 RepID=A0A1I8G562_9PLAT
MAEIDDEVLQDLYAWIDQIPLSRPKKNIARDFSDGVLMAEVVKHYFPRLVDLHNFNPCNNTEQKKKNWMLLNWKTFKKLNFELSNDVIDSIINAKAGTIERAAHASDAPEADQASLRHGGAGVSKMSPSRSPKAAGYGRPTQQPPRKSESLQNIGQSDYVTRLAYEEKVQECLAKDETVEILQAKIRRLEHLLHLKDVRIDDLQSRLEELRPTGQPQVQETKKVAVPRAK